MNGLIHPCSVFFVVFRAASAHVKACGAGSDPSFHLDLLPHQEQRPPASRTQSPTIGTTMSAAKTPNDSLRYEPLPRITVEVRRSDELSERDAPPSKKGRGADNAHNKTLKR